LHLIGKDILTTHSVYWPTMLQAAGLPQPRTIFAHGWWIMGGAKMSKSRGEVVKPLDLAEVYGVDGLRYFLMREMTPGRDADFSAEGLDRRYQAELANDLGNLLHRLVNMTGRYHEGRVPQSGELTGEEEALRARCLALPEATFEHVEALAINDALGEVMEVVGEINRYLEQTAPWKRAKAGEEERVATILYTALEGLRLASVLLQPVMPERMAELWRRLGWQVPEELNAALAWGELEPGTRVVEGEPLFPRDVE
jgi:methionyl-tRNA synthetase